MAVLYAFDGAGPFDLAAAKAHGAVAVTTYIRGKPGGFDPATPARVARIRAEGLGASPNWEAQANFFDTASLEDARWAGQDALAACQRLNYPGDGSVAVSFSFDFDSATSRLPEMGQKLQAAQYGMNGHYAAMGYGEQELLDYFAAHKIGTPKHWLMMSTFGQPYTPAAPSVCMVQGHDVAGNWIQSQAIPDTDINTVTDPYALRAWWPDNSIYAQEADVRLDPEDPIIKWIQGKLQGLDDGLTISQTQSMYNRVLEIAARKAPDVNLTPQQIADIAAELAALPPHEFTVTSTVAPG